MRPFPLLITLLIRAVYSVEISLSSKEISWANPNYMYVSTYPGIFSNKKMYRSILRLPETRDD